MAKNDPQEDPSGAKKAKKQKVDVGLTVIEEQIDTVNVSEKGCYPGMTTVEFNGPVTINFNLEGVPIGGLLGVISKFGQSIGLGDPSSGDEKSPSEDDTPGAD